MSAIILALLAQWNPPTPGPLQWDPYANCKRTGGRCFENRTGYRPAANYAFFELAPANGAGMGSACSCVNPTGAKGEALAVSRTSGATCSRQGVATSGIVDGDLTTCGNNIARVESSGGVLGIRSESTRTNSLLRFIEICDAAWADVGTPALTGQTVTGTACATTTPQNSPFTGTYATAAVLMEDNDAAGFEGRTQTVSGLTAGQPVTMHCYVKAGTATTARITVDATTANISGLSTTTWSIIEAIDASASATSVVAETLVGNSTGVTGNVIWGGCQVEQGGYRTSIIPTTSAAATRQLDNISLTLPSSVGPSASIAASMQFVSSAVGAVNVFALGSAGDNLTLYRVGDTTAGFQINATATSPVVASMGTAVQRAALADASGTRSAFWNGGSVSAPAASMGAGVTAVWVGRNVSGIPMEGIITRMCIDPTPSRCR